MKQDQVFLFAATTDLWLSIVMDLYISHTVHYLTDNWKLKNRC